MPAVADPGSSVVRAAHELGLAVRAADRPGVAAAGAGGERPQRPELRLRRLPAAGRAQRAPQRIRELEALALRSGQTQLFIETPYRNAALLQALLQTLQHHTRLAVARGLTLPGAAVRSDTVKAWRARPVAADERLPAVFAIGR